MKKQHQPKFTYMKLPPSKWIFQYPRMREWMYLKVAEKFNVQEPVLNLFAGKTLLKPMFEEYRVDIVEEFEDNGTIYKTYADYVGGGLEYAQDYQSLMRIADAKPYKITFLDPPFSVRKSREKYGDRQIGSFTKIKNELLSILSDDSRVITWGYSSVGMSAKRGYELTEVLLICHSGDHNDTIVTVEDRIVDGND